MSRPTSPGLEVAQVGEQLHVLAAVVRSTVSLKRTARARIVAREEAGMKKLCQSESCSRKAAQRTASTPASVHAAMASRSRSTAASRLPNRSSSQATICSEKS